MGVVLGFIAGNILLSFIGGSGTTTILFREILIASLGLLAIPKGVKIVIEDLYGKTKFLPVDSKKILEQNEDTVFKLNNMSEVIEEISETYKQVACSVVEEEDVVANCQNREVFLEELRNRLDRLEQNILYDDFENPEEGIIDELFHILLENGQIEKDQLVEVFENHNNYMIGFESKEVSKKIENDIEEMVKVINDSYKISKINFIWKKKIEENKKTIGEQLNGVSRAISNLADEIESKAGKEHEDLEEEIKLVLLQKNIVVRDIELKQVDHKYIVKLYIQRKEELDQKQIENLLGKILKQEMTVTRTGLIPSGDEDDTSIFLCYAKDKYKIQLGIAKKTKEGSSVSGDSNIQVKLEDGKQLIAISDGMGSGPNARKDSKIALKMLQRLLLSRV